MLFSLPGMPFTHSTINHMNLYSSCKTQLTIANSMKTSKPQTFGFPHLGSLQVSYRYLLSCISKTLFLFIFFTFHLSSPFCVLLQGQTASPSSFWQLIRCPEPSKYSKKCWKNNQGKKICQESSTGPPRGANRSGWGAPSTECCKVPM